MASERLAPSTATAAEAKVAADKALATADAALKAANDAKAAAEKKAVETGVPQCIAVADESGNLLAFSRMDGGKVSSIRIAIDNFSLASGRMPTPELTYQMVLQAAPNYARLIYERKIVLNPAGHREDVWAFEAVSKANPSVYVLFATGVEEMTPTALRARLGR